MSLQTKETVGHVHTDQPVAILELKSGAGHCGAKEKVGRQHECLSCMVVFRCLEDDLPYQTQHRLVIIVKYELYGHYSLDTPKRHCRCNHTHVPLCRLFCANHATSTALTHV